MKLGRPEAKVSVETVPTGCLSLDLALGLGGTKRTVIEVYGPDQRQDYSGPSYDRRSTEKRRNRRVLLMQSMRWIPFMQRT